MPGKLWVRVSVVRSIHRLCREGIGRDRPLGRFCHTPPARRVRQCRAPEKAGPAWLRYKYSFPRFVHLELILLVLGAFVKRPVVPELPHIVDPVEALDAIWDSVHPQDIHIVWNGRHRIDLQVWAGSEGETQAAKEMDLNG